LQPCRHQPNVPWNVNFSGKNSISQRGTGAERLFEISQKESFSSVIQIINWTMNFILPTLIWHPVSNKTVSQWLSFGISFTQDRVITTFTNITGKYC